MKAHRYLLSIIGLFLFTNVAAQQVEYHYFDKHDGVRIDYRWTRANMLNRNSDAVLYLQLTNENDFPVRVAYSVGFYRDDQLFMQSDEHVLCLEPGQRRRGSRTDMRYSAEGINLVMTEEAWFSWDLIDFHAEEASCK